MPTFNQLVRKGRESVEKKSTAPSSSERVELPEEKQSPEFSTETLCTCMQSEPRHQRNQLRAA